MLKIGLTGGIASGKTHISDLFSQLQVPVIDTDIISRTALEPGHAGYKEVTTRFGEEILLIDRQIDRRKLRQIIFEDSIEKRWLESVLHPIIFEQTQCQIEHYKGASYVIVVVPLLFETNFRALVDRVLVVDCPAKTQIERLLVRDNIELDLAQQMLSQQWSNQDRLAQADDIIHNASNLALDEQVGTLHQRYLQLSEKILPSSL
jgi:dephospho-CoA kinase